MDLSRNYFVLCEALLPEFPMNPECHLRRCQALTDGIILFPVPKLTKLRLQDFWVFMFRLNNLDFARYSLVT